MSQSSQSSAPEAYVKLERVGVRYPGGCALEDVSLSIAPGEIVALVGPSGAGKTTLLRLLGAVLSPTSGRVLINGRDPALLRSKELRALRARIGTVRQDLGLVPNLRVSQNVLTGRLGRLGLIASLRSVVLPRKRELEAVHATLERLALEDKLFERCDELSGGQQQRVAIARALYQEPDVLLADEPLSALDPTLSREVLGLLIELARERELSLVLSLHDLELAREFVPRLVGLRKGRVHIDSRAADIDAQAFTALYELDAAGQAVP